MIVINPTLNFYTIPLDAVECEENDSDVPEQSSYLTTEPGASSPQPFKLQIQHSHLQPSLIDNNNAVSIKIVYITGTLKLQPCQRSTPGFSGQCRQIGVGIFPSHVIRKSPHFREPSTLQVAGDNVYRRAGQKAMQIYAVSSMGCKIGRGVSSDHSLSIGNEFDLPGILGFSETWPAEASNDSNLDMMNINSWTGPDEAQDARIYKAAK